MLYLADIKVEDTKRMEREHIQRCIIELDRQWITKFSLQRLGYFSKAKILYLIFCNKKNLFPEFIQLISLMYYDVLVHEA